MFKNLTVRSQLALGILTVLAVFAVANVASFIALRHLIGTVNEINDLSVDYSRSHRSWKNLARMCFWASGVSPESPGAVLSGQ